MRLYKRGSVWWFELDFDRKQIRKSTRTKDRKAAGQIMSAFHLALVKGDVGIVERKPVPQFGAAMKAFLAWSTVEHSAHPATAERYKFSSYPLLKFYRETPIDRITPEDVERYKQERAKARRKGSDRKLRPATVNRELACLRAMFNHAIKANDALRNPVSKVKFLAEDNQQERVLTFAEQDAYLACATATLQDVAGLILETGMRPEEVFTLRAANIDLSAGFVKVLRGKTPAAKRRIELTAAAHTILASRIETAGADYLFPCDGDGKRPLQSVQSAHTRALKESKVSQFRPYDLRHTWATRAAEAGIDLVTLAAMMGHSRIQMVLRYAHPTQGHQTSAMQMLQKHKVAAEAREKAEARRAAERAAGGEKLVVMKRA